MIEVGGAAPSLHGQPVFGRPFHLDQVRARGSVVVGFLGALSSAATLQNLARLTEVWPQVDAKAGGLVVVTRSPLETARDFVPRHHVLFPMLVDESGELCAAWGVQAATGAGAVWVRARPALLSRALSVLRNGQPLPEAHVDQAPAAFVVGKDGVVRHAWYGGSVGALVPAEALWAAC